MIESLRFNFPAPQASCLRPGEIAVDLFAGGGGASEGLKQALGIDPALAYNHCAAAIGMHAANHPLTQHHREDIWHADPRIDVAGRPVGWFHASPDCTHFSQAKGGQPRSRKTRALSWVVLKWAGQLRAADRRNGTQTQPRIISMENVWQILAWGPLVAKRCRDTGRVLRMDGTVAEPGERVPVENQQLIPDKRHSGRTWAQFTAALRALGYAVEWRKLRACDYGAGTSRERLFLIARRDDQPIAWPEATHGPGTAQPFVSAADCIDFSDTGRSIFNRPRPLADATLRRIAKGLQRHVLDAAEPFFLEVADEAARDTSGVPQSLAGSGVARRNPARAKTVQRPGVREGGRRAGYVQGQIHRQNGPVRAGSSTAPTAHADSGAFLTEFANASTGRTWSASEPLRTQCAGVKGGHFALVAPILAGVGGRAGQTEPRPGSEPLYTITTKADTALVSAFLEQANGGFAADNSGHDLRKPMSTITASGSQQRLVSVDLARLSDEQREGAERVAAFLINYYGAGTALDVRDPLATITTRDRMALVTVHVRGVPHVITDIRLRMLKPAELYRAQGFPSGYIIDRRADGTPLSVTEAVRMVGNSVSPPPLAAIARANLDRAHNLAVAA